jgi:hypothetical protein
VIKKTFSLLPQICRRIALCIVCVPLMHNVHSAVDGTLNQQKNDDCYSHFLPSEGMMRARDEKMWEIIHFKGHCYEKSGFS